MKRPLRTQHAPPVSTRDVAVNDVFPIIHNGASVYVRVLGVRANTLRVNIVGVERVYDVRDGSLRELREKG